MNNMSFKTGSVDFVSQDNQNEHNLHIARSSRAERQHANKQKSLLNGKPGVFRKLISATSAFKDPRRSIMGEHRSTSDAINYISCKPLVNVPTEIIHLSKNMNVRSSHDDENIRHYLNNIKSAPLPRAQCEPVNHLEDLQAMSSIEALSATNKDLLLMFEREQAETKSSQRVGVSSSNHSNLRNTVSSFDFPMPPAHVKNSSFCKSSSASDNMSRSSRSAATCSTFSSFSVDYSSTSKPIQQLNKALSNFETTVCSLDRYHSNHSSALSRKSSRSNEISAKLIDRDVVEKRIKALEQRNWMLEQTMLCMLKATQSAIHIAYLEQDPKYGTTSEFIPDLQCGQTEFRNETSQSERINPQLGFTDTRGRRMKIR
ncbi:hypothetical protein V1514DRAFT_39710 [Lipomyces japonicus]|uniref:uncharacterized protein n=1 Tax=Lipomyces japonicus TaxID=56871 RepID=UPI0034CF2A6E